MSSNNSHAYAGLEQPDTNNATWFNPKEKAEDDYWDEDDYCDGEAAFRFQKKRKWFSYLEELNQGIRNGKRTHNPYWTFRDNRDMIEQIANQMGLSDTQSKRAKRDYWYVHVEEDQEGKTRISGIRKDSVGIAVCAYTVKTDENDSRQFHPQDELSENDREWGETVADRLAARFNISARKITSAYGKVSHHLRRAESSEFSSNFDRKKMDRRGLYEDPANEFEQESLFGTTGGMGGGI